MAEPIESRADLVRQRLFRSVFEPSSLDEVAAAVTVAVAEQAGDIYVERLLGRFRWSLCHRGGSYPLLRITARFLKVDHRQAFIGFYTVPGDWCILVKDPIDRIEPDAWAVLTLAELTSSANVGIAIRTALERGENLWPIQRTAPTAPTSPPENDPGPESRNGWES